jgi:gamma-glutamyl hydrolase
MIQGYLLVMAFCFINVCANPPQTPVIGIYTEYIPKSIVFEDYSMYVISSYVKNLEMAGAQVVPIFYNYPIEQLKDILSKVNGVFFPGGEASIDISN